MSYPNFEPKRPVVITVPEKDASKLRIEIRNLILKDAVPEELKEFLFQAYQSLGKP